MMRRFAFYYSNSSIEISGNLPRSIYVTKNINASANNYFLFPIFSWNDKLQTQVKK